MPLPVHLLTTGDGLVVALTSVAPGLTTGVPKEPCVIVTLEIQRTEETEWRIAAYAGQLEAWSYARREGDAEGPPPAQLAEFLLRLPLTLRDDRGTAFRARSSSAGGTNTDYLGTFRFTPSPPADATTLTVELDGEPCATVRLAHPGTWEPID